jgi:hypothetical protein
LFPGLRASVRRQWFDGVLTPEKKTKTSLIGVVMGSLQILKFNNPITVN